MNAYPISYGVPKSAGGTTMLTRTSASGSPVRCEVTCPESATTPASAPGAISTQDAASVSAVQRFEAADPSCLKYMESLPGFLRASICRRPRSRNPTPEMRWRGRSVHNRGFAARSALVTHYFVDLNPIAISLGPVQVRWYGIMYVIGIGIAWWLGNRRRAAGRLPISADQFSDLTFYVALGVILGGRIGYMIFYDTAELIQHPLSLFRVWEGGMAFHGGLLGVLAAALWWTRRNRLNFFDVVDFVAPLVPIGLALGRLGNFIGGELWGRHTDLPWGMIFPRALESLGKSKEELYHMYLAGELDRGGAASLAAL